MAAPWAFVTTAALFLSIGFAVGRFFLSEQIANLRSRIEARDEQIDSLKAQVSDTSPFGPDDGKRFYLIGQLTAEYLSENPGAPRRMHLGLEEPPVEWMNAELEKLGEDWRVKIGENGRYRIYDLSRWG